MGRLRSKLSVILAGALTLAFTGGASLLIAGGRDGGSSADGERAVDSAPTPHPAAGSFAPDDTELADCRERRCYEQAFGNLVFNEGPEEAFEIFDAAIAAGGEIEAGCHRIAHFMGAAALARHEGDVGRAFSEGSSSCWSGYYHGILEWSLQDVPAGELASVARGLCDEIRAEETTFLLFQCVHGLGHGLMITTGYELPDALGVCDRLETEWDRDSCRGGVFMENIATAEGSPIEVTGKPRWLRDDDLLYPCNADRVVPEEAKDQCYIMVTSRVLQANGYEFAGAAGWCERAEREWVPTCFQSLGRDSSGSTRYDPRETVRRCRAAGEHLEDCLWGAARDYTSRFAGGEEAAELCMTGPKDLRSRCFEGIGTIVATQHATARERAAACRALGQAHRRDCVRGLGDPGQPDAVPRS